MSSTNYQLPTNNKTLSQLITEANQIFEAMENSAKKILAITGTAFPLDYDKHANYGKKGTAQFEANHTAWREELEREVLITDLINEINKPGIIGMEDMVL